MDALKSLVLLQQVEQLSVNELSKVVGAVSPLLERVCHTVQTCK